jgi:hypothetical protein
MRFDSSLDIGFVRSESVTDLNSELMGGSGMRESRSRPSTVPGFGKVSSDGDHISPSPKPFGLGEYAVNSVSFSTMYMKAHYWYMNIMSFLFIMVSHIHLLENLQIIPDIYNGDLGGGGGGGRFGGG